MNLGKVQNPYGERGASGLVVEIIKNDTLDGLKKKSFYDFCNE